MTRRRPTEQEINDTHTHTQGKGHNRSSRSSKLVTSIYAAGRADNVQMPETAAFLSEFSLIAIKGTARTLVPTNKNCALEPPLFGVVVRVSPLGVQ